MDKNNHLESVIKTHQIAKEEELLNKHRQKKDEITRFFPLSNFFWDTPIE